MIEGHPWATAGLDEARARQRRELRDVDDHVLRTLDRLDVGSAVSNADRFMLEAYLRRLADASKDARSGLGDEGRALSHVAAEFFQKVALDAPVRGADEMFAADHATAVEHRAAVGSVRDELSGAELVAAKRALYLLVWADQLAGDYSDPRIAQQ